MFMYSTWQSADMSFLAREFTCGINTCTHRPLTHPHVGIRAGLLIVSCDQSCCIYHR